MPRIVVADEGKVGEHTVFACGSSDLYTNLGVIDSNNEPVYSRRFPAKVHRLQGQNIEQIAAGVVHSAAVLKNGTLFIWGTNDDNAVGRENEDYPGPVTKFFHWTQQRSSLAPIPVSEVFVVEVVCGDCHTLVRSASGDLYSCGTYKNGNGYLGFLSNIHKQEYLTRIDVPGVRLTAKSIAAGTHFDLCVTVEGNVYEWGDISRKHQHDFRLNNQLMPRIVPMSTRRINGKRVYPEKVFASDYSRFVLTRNGHVFGWGNNQCGQAGVFGGEGELIEPTHIEQLDRLGIVKIVGGDRHTIALTQKGEVYGWGSNEYGQLGLVPASKHKPGVNWKVTKVPLPRGSCAVDISAGTTHSLIALKRGRPLVFGLGSSYQCGNGKGDLEETIAMQAGDKSFEVRVLTPEPVGGQKLDGYQVVQVAGNTLHSMFLARQE